MTGLFSTSMQIWSAYQLVDGVLWVLKNAYNSPDEFTGTNRLSGIAAGITTLLSGGQPHPDHRPQGRARLFRVIGGPLALNLAWLTILVGLPQVLGSLSMVLAGFPDLGYVLIGSGVVALGWSVLRTGLTWATLRNRRAPLLPGS